MMDAIELTGKVAIVTGAAGALGKAYAQLLAARGAAVVVNDLGGDTCGANGGIGLAEAVAQDIRHLFDLVDGAHVPTMLTQGS